MESCENLTASLIFPNKWERDRSNYEITAPGNCYEITLRICSFCGLRVN